MGPDHATYDLHAYNGRPGLTEDTVRQKTHGTGPDNRLKPLLLYAHLLLLSPLFIVLQNAVNYIAAKNRYIGLLNLADGIRQDFHIKC